MKIVGVCVCGEARKVRNFIEAALRHDCIFLCDVEEGSGHLGKEERCVQWYLLIPIPEEVVLEFSEEVGVQVGITHAA